MSSFSLYDTKNINTVFFNIRGKIIECYTKIDFITLHICLNYRSVQLNFNLNALYSYEQFIKIIIYDLFFKFVVNEGIKMSDF